MRASACATSEGYSCRATAAKHVPARTTDRCWRFSASAGEDHSANARAKSGEASVRAHFSRNSSGFGVHPTRSTACAVSSRNEVADCAANSLRSDRTFVLLVSDRDVPRPNEAFYAVPLVAGLRRAIEPGPGVQREMNKLGSHLDHAFSFYRTGDLFSSCGQKNSRTRRCLQWGPFHKPEEPHPCTPNSLERNSAIVRRRRSVAVAQLCFLLLDLKN
jgi:hypothetical protein